MSAGPCRPRSRNHALEQVVTTSGASHKALALRVNQLAAARGIHTRYTHTSWANWTRRGVTPEPRIRPLIAQALAERLGRPVSLAELDLDPSDTDDDAIGLTFPRDLPEAIHAATHFWSRVDRRDFLTTSGLAMATYTTPVRRWLTTPSDPSAHHQGDPASPRVDMTDVAELLTAADDARRWDSQYGGGHWRTSALAICLQQRATPLLRGRYTDTVGRHLFSATAQLSRLAGWTAFDTGHHALAQRHYIQALRHARAAGDIPLGGYILACMALQASLRGFHDDAIDMAQAAYERARPTATPRTIAFAKLIEARAHARAGDRHAAGTTLAHAERLLGYAAQRTGDDPTWIDFLTHTRLAADATEIHRDLGQPTHARHWNNQTATPTDRYARSHGLRLTVIATTYLQHPNPDLDNALHHAHQAINTLTRVNSARARDYTTNLLNHLTPWRTEPAVQHLTHRAYTELQLTQ